jgi:hypothetical protein
MHQNSAGIYFEQSTPVVLEPVPSAAELGAAFRRAFDAFYVLDKNLGDVKKSDWPSFTVSRLRSVKEFERQYRCIHCIGLSESNAVVRASVSHPSAEGVELAASFNPLLSPEVIGKCLLTLAGLSMPPNNSFESDAFKATRASS